MSALTRDVLPRVACLLNRNLCQSQHTLVCCLKFHGTSPKASTPKKPVRKSQKISKAMQLFLEKANKEAKLMEEYSQEYELGRRHLANIMGVDPEEFDRKHVDQAIEYLLPSGLHEPKARPLFKHPSEVLPRSKVAAFNVAGKPHHHLYYSLKPQYYGLMHEISSKIEYLKEKYFKDNQNNTEDTVKPLKLPTSQWISEKEFLSKFEDEKLTTQDYDRFIIIMNRLLEHPLARLEVDYIMKYREYIKGFEEIVIPDLSIEEETGRRYSECIGYRKAARASVRVYAEGSGIFDINGQGIEYFEALTHRKAVLFPLSLSELIGKVDIHCTVEGGGPTGQSGAIRYALAHALKAHTYKDVIEKFYFTGLLSVDYRRAERKKPGLKGARRGPTWKAR